MNRTAGIYLWGRRVVLFSIMLRLARLMAYAGGLALSLLIIMTCLSIAGRSASRFLNTDFMQTHMPSASDWLLVLGVGPIRGDVELVEVGMAFTIFAFLPICQITGGHAVVDVFVGFLSKRVNKLLQIVADILFAGVLTLIAVQLYGGFESKLSSGQTTFLREFPLWWAYGASLVGAALAALIAIYVMFERMRGFVTGHTSLPREMGVEY